MTPTTIWRVLMFPSTAVTSEHCTELSHTCPKGANSEGHDLTQGAHIPEVVKEVIFLINSKRKTINTWCFHCFTTGHSAGREWRGSTPPAPDVHRTLSRPPFSHLPDTIQHIGRVISEGKYVCVLLHQESCPPPGSFAGWKCLSAPDHSLDTFKQS